MEQLDRITQQPGIMGGKACIHNRRVTVGMIVGQLAAGRSMDALLVDYPYLEQEDIAQALRYAANRGLGSNGYFYKRQDNGLSKV